MTEPFRITFRKEERLCSRKRLQQLFNKENSYQHFKYPLKAVWQFAAEDAPFPAQVVFPVSKKNFKRAHDRNRLRRLVREAYRLQKNGLYEALSRENVFCILSISYIAKEKHSYQLIFDATENILHQIARGAAEHSGHYTAGADAIL